MRKDTVSKAFMVGALFLFICICIHPAFAKDITIDNTNLQLENICSIITNQENPVGDTFLKTYGGTEDDQGYFVQQTNDNGFIITGYTSSFGAGESDAWLIKTDSTGNKVWDKTFGGIYEDCGFCVQQTSDGGYIIIGEKDDHALVEGHVWLIKTDSDGNKEWDKTFGGTGYDDHWYVQQTTDEGFIITGESSNEDVRLIKTDRNGNKMWDRTFGGENADRGRCVQQTTDGGYIITGETRSFGDIYNAVWLIKTDSSGNLEWNKTFEKSEYDQGFSVQQTTDGGYIITGLTAWSGKDNVWLIKTDDAGNKVWDKTFGETCGLCVRQTTDGGYIIVGSKAFTFNDVYLIKTDSTGNKEWDKVLGGQYYDWGRCVQQTSDEGYIITGVTDSLFGSNQEDVLLIKTDKDGNVKSKAITGKMLLLRIIERFPLLQKLLQQFGF